MNALEDLVFEHVLRRIHLGRVFHRLMHDQPNHRLLAPFLACYEELTRFITRKLGCRDLASDVVQETYLRVTRGPAGDVLHPRAFLYRTAANLVTDVLRKRQLRSLHEVSDVLTDQIPSQAPSPETALHAQQQVLLLRQAVKSLPPKCRTVFLLHKADHMPYAEIAARLHISTSAVEKHMSKALAHCRDFLEQSE